MPPKRSALRIKVLSLDVPHDVVQGLHLRNRMGWWLLWICMVLDPLTPKSVGTSETPGNTCEYSLAKFNV